MAFFQQCDLDSHEALTLQAVGGKATSGWATFCEDMWPSHPSLFQCYKAALANGVCP